MPGAKITMPTPVVSSLLTIPAWQYGCEHLKTASAVGDHCPTQLAQNLEVRDVALAAASIAWTLKEEDLGMRPMGR